MGLCDRPSQRCSRSRIPVAAAGRSDAWQQQPPFPQHHLAGFACCDSRASLDFHPSRSAHHVPPGLRNREVTLLAVSRPQMNRQARPLRLVWCRSHADGSCGKLACAGGRSSNAGNTSHAVPRGPRHRVERYACGWFRATACPESHRPDFVSCDLRASGYLASSCQWPVERWEPQELVLAGRAERPRRGGHDTNTTRQRRRTPTRQSEPALVPNGRCSHDLPTCKQSRCPVRQLHSGKTTARRAHRFARWLRH